LVLRRVREISNVVVRPPCAPALWRWRLSVANVGSDRMRGIDERPW
jgi:hypothetical protein